MSENLTLKSKEIRQAFQKNHNLKKRQDFATDQTLETDTNLENNTVRLF